MNRKTGKVVLACLAALLCVGPVAATGAEAAQIDDESPFTTSEIVITIDVQRNGSAVWTIAYQYRLNTSERRRGFERLSQNVDAQRDDYVSGIRRDVGETVAVTSNRTGRSMSLSGVGVRTHYQSIPQEVGTVVHRFVWHDFAETDGSTIRAGDALRGFYLGPRTVLEINWPSSYSSARLEPAPDATSSDGASWSDRRFDTDEPRVVLERGSDSPPAPLLSAIGMLLLVASAGTVAYARRNGDGLPTPGGTDDDSDPSTGGSPSAPDGTRSEEEPPEPLSDAERVKWVLEAHGGRVKQQTIAAECEWGDSKTSKVVGELHDAGEIDRFRLGRENVITLPEVKYDDE